MGYYVTGYRPTRKHIEFDIKLAENWVRDAEEALSKAIDELQRAKASLAEEKAVLAKLDKCKNCPYSEGMDDCCLDVDYRECEYRED